MKIEIEAGTSPLLIVGETYEKIENWVEGSFRTDEANTSIRVGIITKAPVEYLSPHFIELKREDISKQADSEFSDEIVETLRRYIVDNGITKVICVGRSTFSKLFPSLVGKGKTLAKLVQSPFIESLELPGVSGACIYGYRTAFDKNIQDALNEYWQRFSELFLIKPKYDVTESKIETEEEFISLLNFLSSLGEEYIIGLDYETNAVDQFSEYYRTTCIGLAYLKKGEKSSTSFWYYIKDGMSDTLRETTANFFDKNHHRIWTYNCAFEIKTSWHEFGKHWEFQDAMVLLTVQGLRGSLKDNMRNLLGATLWESSVTEYREKAEELYKFIRAKKWKDEFLELIGKGEIEEAVSMHSNIQSVYDWCEENYEGTFTDLVNAYPYPWASVPGDILGPYCAKDAGYTLFLADEYYTDEYATAYNFCVPHPWLAAKFEVNGSYWDDVKASKIEDDLAEKGLKHLYELIQALDTISYDDKMKAKDIYFKELPYEVISYTLKTNKEKRRSVETVIDKIEELKSILNPGSNTAESRAKFWDCYFTDELKMGTILNLAIEDMEFNQKLKPLLEVLGKDYFHVNPPLVALELLSTLEEKYPDLDSEVISQANRSLSLAIDSLPEYSGKYASEVVKYQYQVHTRYFGLDINDEKTWSKEWKMLFDLFVFKKIAKTISTNINGTIGRSVVYEIVGELHGRPLRGKSYFDGATSSSKMVMNNSFNSLSADTLRWSSGFHTISAGSPVREALIPPAEEYVNVHSDFSQAEIVTLSYYSQDERLIQAFIDGKDMHRYVASLAFSKPYDEVSSEERRSAKAISFGILYGKSVASLALDVSGGDVDKAQEMMDAFFGAFPKIKIWMNSKYQEVDEKGYVTNALGGKLNIDVNQSGNGKYRNACNAPIQCLSNLVAGTSMYELSEVIDKSEIETYPFGFVHDAYDDTIPVDYLLEYLDTQRYIMQWKIREDIGMPMSIDQEIGPNALWMSHLSVVSRSDDRVRIKLKGDKMGQDLLLEKFKKSKRFTIENFEIGKSETSYVSWEELFTVGKALKNTWGNEVTEQVIEIDLVYNKGLAPKLEWLMK